MAEKMLDSTTRAGMTKSSSSSHLPSIYGNGSLELVWQNGQILVHGGSSSATRNTPSCMRNDEDACIAKSARLNTLHSPLDFPLQRDSYLPHQNNDQTKSSIKLKDGCANLRPTTIENGNYLCTPSTQECSPSAPLKKLPIIDSSQTPVTNSQKQDLGKVNFSKVLRPSRFLKSTYQGNSATLHTNNKVLPSVEQIKITKIGKAAAAAATSSKALDHSVVIESSKGSHGFTGLKGQTPKEPLPDEYSEAGHKNALHGSHAQYYNKTSSSGAGLRAKGKADINSCNEPLLESFSVCSLGASNNTNLFSMKHEDTDDSIYSSDNYEEPEDMVKEKPAWEGTRTRVKRSRDAVIHNLNERKRRDKINKKMRVLKELIPNCNKVDKASMLDDAIQYLKTLKFQLQIMSMGTGLCMPLMMLPTAAHHMMNAPRLPQLMGAGMGLRPGTNIPCSLPQFPIPPLLGGTTDNTVGMFGFPDQVPPMPMSHAPFMSMFGNPSAQSLLATSTATNLAENLASSQFPNNSYLIGQAQYATKQAPDQGTN